MDQYRKNRKNVMLTMSQSLNKYCSNLTFTLEPVLLQAKNNPNCEQIAFLCNKTRYVKPNLIRLLPQDPSGPLQRMKRFFDLYLDHDSTFFFKGMDGCHKI